MLSVVTLPREPDMATCCGVPLVEARIVTAESSPNFVRHVTFDIGGTPLEGQMRAGQSFGVIPTGTDTDGKPHKTGKARALWERVAASGWASADPGVQYDTTINEWHTCPVSGRINASNPCSEYMFLDDTACNLASLNLMTFRREDRSFDIAAFTHAVRLWTVVLEISVMMAQFPSRRIAELSYRFRTLGLGYANLGGLLMSLGLSYDPPNGRALCGAITALMTGTAYKTSAEMASELGPFPGFAANRDSMLRVIRNHRRAATFLDTIHQAADALASSLPKEGDFDELPNHLLCVHPCP